MPIEFYHIVHIIAVLTLVSGVTLSLQSEKSGLGAKLSGISAILILVAGFGMMAKNGFTLASPWILIKLFIWTLVTISVPVIAKRYPKYKTKAYYICLILLAIAVYCGIGKPGL